MESYNLSNILLAGSSHMKQKMSHFDDGNEEVFLTVLSVLGHELDQLPLTGMGFSIPCTHTYCLARKCRGISNQIVL